MLANQPLSPKDLEIRVKRYLGLPVRQSTLWLDFGDLLGSAKVRANERQVKEERLKALKDERWELEQKVVEMTSEIRELEEQLSE